MNESVRILILTTRPGEMNSAAQFLGRRQFDVSMSDNLKQGLALTIKKKPDWVFLSANISPTIDKYIELLDQSFGIKPILFGDTLDRNTIARLNQTDCPVMSTQMSGPNVLMKIRQMLTEGASAAIKIGTSSATQKQQFGFIQMKKSHEDRKEAEIDALRDQLFAKSESELVELTPEEIAAATVRNSALTNSDPGHILPILQEAARKLTVPPKDGYVPVGPVQSVNVMVLTGEKSGGYLVMATSLNNVERNAEIEKLRKNVGPALSAKEKMTEQLFGSVDAKVENFPAWAKARAHVICRYPAGTGEIMTSFLPALAPLPKVENHPSGRLLVRMDEIPMDAPVPCSFFIHLAANDRYVCMIRENGHLTETQLQRLLKMGVTGLLIATEDLIQFQLFYVQQKLFQLSLAVAA